MTRLAILFLLLLLTPAHAEPQTSSLLAANAFNQTLAAEVFTTALVFMAPRTLEPVSIPQIALWSLQGISTVDASLMPEFRGGQLVLAGPGGQLLEIATPGAEDTPGWGQAAAQIAAAAWDASPAIRRVGTKGLIRNMFDELFNHLDPYSRYVGPEDAQNDRDRRSGAAGIGVVPAVRGGFVVIQEVTADSPAAVAGLRPGDRILAVDGVKPARRDPAAVAALLAGEPDTDVTLTLHRDGRARMVTLSRALIPPETVFAERSGNMLVLHITGFNRATDSRVAHELEQALRATTPPSGLALDLRGNRGGLLRQAVATAALLLGDGLVATTVGRDPDADHVWQASGRDLLDGLPLVVVVDGRSASAAEIVAAALADDRRAVVLGSTTLGKGLVQTITPLPDGGELLVTWSRVLAPLGWPIQGLGVLPQVCTSLGEDTLQRQLAALAQGQQPMQRALARHRSARAPMAVAQMLDIRNACPAAVGRDGDLETARYLIDNPGIYAAALLVPAELLSARRGSGGP